MMRLLFASLLIASVLSIPILKADQPGTFCRYKNASMEDSCNDGGACAIQNLTSAIDFCENLYTHDFAVELPFMSSNFTTPYLDGVPGCPANGVDTFHVPLLAFRTGNRYRSSVCSLTCGKMCERIADHQAYRTANLMTAMVPMCHCKGLAKTPLVRIPLQYESQDENATRFLRSN